MLLLAMAIGVAAVVVLTSLGEAARRFVSGEFSSLGTHLIIVLPGRSETTGGGLNLIMGETPRDLTIRDAIALERISAVDQIAPVVLGAAGVQWGGLEREVPILGSTASLLEIRHWEMETGRFLPPGDPERAVSVAVIGSKLKEELFGDSPAIGEWLRIGDRRFRVSGILGTEGRTVGIDVQDVAVIPVASAQALFNTESLFRIIVSARSREEMDRVKEEIVSVITERHQGEEDVTVITQDAVLATFDRIFGALTLALAGIAAVSLAVAGILIMNVMLVAVSQRTPEIGLLKALGAARGQIMALFLTEAVMLSLTGAIVGLAVGQTGSWLIGRLYPALPVGPPVWAPVAAVAIAVASGVGFGILPARRAAVLDPVEALAGR
jgi:putative ABC transport system permease protein